MSRKPSILAGSHLVLATDDVSRMVRFFGELFEIEPYFANKEFAEFVLASRFRIAFFKATGAASKHFRASSEREGCGIGITVVDVDATYRRALTLDGGCQVSGPPKEHPWGEKSFLLVDPDGNRWEVVQTPSADGMLVNR